jgi:hypothetical protein
MRSKGPSVSLLSFGGVRKDCFSFFLSNVFSSSSQMHPQIPNLLPKMLLIAPHFYSLCFGQS